MQLSQALQEDVAHEIRRRGGGRRIIIFEFPDASFIGRSLAELAAERGLSEVEMAIQLQLEGFPDRRGGGRLRGFSLDEVDIELYAAQPWVATASDAGVTLPEDGPDVHARFYGTFPRKIRRYVMERGSLSLEDAVRSMTSLPAQILGLRDRGMIREGMIADLVVLDPERLRDKATFEQPHQFAEGIEYVLVNGRLVVEHGVPTGELPGALLLRPHGASLREGDGKAGRSR